MCIRDSHILNCAIKHTELLCMLLINSEARQKQSINRCHQRTNDSARTTFGPATLILHMYGNRVTQALGFKPRSRGVRGRTKLSVSSHKLNLLASTHLIREAVVKGPTRNWLHLTALEVFPEGCRISRLASAATELNSAQLLRSAVPSPNIATSTLILKACTPQVLNSL